MTAKAVMVLCALVLSAPATTMCQQAHKTNHPLASTPEQLGASLVKALLSENVADDDRLLHPAMRSCPTLTDPVYQKSVTWARAQARKRISGPYVVRVYEETDSLGSASAFEPVRPTLRMQVDFDEKSFHIVRRIGKLGQEWFIVTPCYTSVGLAALKQLQ